MVRLAIAALDRDEIDHDAWLTIGRSFAESHRTLHIELHLVAAEVFWHIGRVAEARAWAQRARVTSSAAIGCGKSGWRTCANACSTTTGLATGYDR